jgi:hypothetical protein
MPCAANDSGEWRRYTSDFGLNGASVIEVLQTAHSCGLLDRLIANDYEKCGMKVLTHDLRMSRLPAAQKL